MAAVIRMHPMLLQLTLTSFVFLSCLRNGNAGITSTFIRSEYPSVDIPLDNKVFAVPKGHNAPQQVHITQGDYDGKAVIISWVTLMNQGRVKCNMSGYIHHCLVDGLEHDTKYYYKIGSGDSSREFWFTTPPKIDPNSRYTFGIIGDLGQTFNSLSTLEHYMQSKGQAVLFLGDLSYADRYQYNEVGLRWDTWGRFVEQSTAYQPWIWSAGNHEIEFMPYLGEVTPFKSYLQRYATPYLASKSSNPLWYAIRRASAHIIVLSSYSPFVKYTPQWRWLEEELKRYRISNIHNNITSGDQNPIPDKSAPVYITVGDGGNQEGLAGRFKDPQPDYSAFREAAYGHSTLEIINRTHALYHWNRNDDGKKIATDAFVLHNQYWGMNHRRRKLKKHYVRKSLEQIAIY
ncbi:bifunctional purple acid phosphatase 26-like isoform X4 [Prunus yedoensis var. nudiflora]|uniref:Purple acid phosphatase n=1 Tax=Prunus yedoensis var. nudiflora TaxID=2094558 RepID=A0A314Y028_PRUYE|nr:bifunctional purple acid phosphatase 26-like isoform X4 [Prunus yedoensis var. nudiflora]